MRNAFGRPAQRRRPTINITSLIDVMFLLLIFFMVSSVFRDTIGLDISLPAASTATEQKSVPYEIFITDDGSITFGEEQGLSLEELEEALRALIAREPEARMALTADGAAAFKDAVSVIDIARNVGGSKLIIRTKLPKGVNPEEIQGER